MLLFYWLTSLVLAISGYYLLRLLMPYNYVFGAWYRMFVYHWEHPNQYIVIPCFFYGIFATRFTALFAQKNLKGKLLLILLIIILTILFSSPFGGMLWYYHDMQAGFFPANWGMVMIEKGFQQGLETGWLIIALSFPYNVLGVVICYYLTKKGTALFVAQGFTPS